MKDRNRSKTRVPATDVHKAKHLKIKCMNNQNKMQK